MSKNVLSSGVIVPSKPSTRKPLHGGNRNADIRYEANTQRSCTKCKWGAADPTDPIKGQCVAMRTKMGAIWKRYISDYANMTCDYFEEGQIDFREHV